MKDESKLLGRSYSSFIPHPSSFDYGARGRIRTGDIGFADRRLSQLGYACIFGRKETFELSTVTEVRISG